MARPKKEIDRVQVEELAAIGCTVSEIAAVMDCNKKTLERRFVAAIEKGRERLKESLRRAQVKSAINGNATMLIWLGKQYLGQRDKVDVDVQDRRERAEAAIKSLIKDTGISREEAITQLSARIQGFSELASQLIQ